MEDISKDIQEYHEKYETFLQALRMFEKSIDIYNEVKNKHVTITSENNSNIYEDILIAARESAIQRFEYSIELFWKLLYRYLTIQTPALPPQSGAGQVIRVCTQLGMITELEAKEFTKMIRARNETSHIYRQEVALILIQDLPHYLTSLQTIVPRFIIS